MSEINAKDIDRYLKRFYQTDEEAIGGTIEKIDVVPFNIKFEVIEKYIFKPKKAVIKYE